MYFIRRSGQTPAAVLRAASATSTSNLVCLFDAEFKYTWRYLLSPLTVKYTVTIMKQAMTPMITQKYHLANEQAQLRERQREREREKWRA